MVKVAKVLVCGMKGIGKTAIIEQLIYGHVTKETELFPTIEDTYIASLDTGKGQRDFLRIFDIGGIGGNAELPRHYIMFPDGFVLVYDPADPSSLDILAGIKNDIDKYKKEVPVIIIANLKPSTIRQTSNDGENPPSPSINPVDSILNRANNWCSREKVKHYICNAMERASLYEPFINLAIKLHPQQAKTAFPQLRQLTQKAQKTDS